MLKNIDFARKTAVIHEKILFFPACLRCKEEEGSKNLPTSGKNSSIQLNQWATEL